VSSIVSTSLFFPACSPRPQGLTAHNLFPKANPSLVVVSPCHPEAWDCLVSSLMTYVFQRIRFEFTCSSSAIPLRTTQFTQITKFGYVRNILHFGMDWPIQSVN